ncbi:MAG: type II toxin-antitoxin system VapC family toxin [Chloroflexaceae bacterium]|nr:type II toxin-antitoxin system VapC family toxin [Chloroflexaceae bacterium]
MTPVFVDTAAWIALFDASDRLAPAARQVLLSLQQARQPLLTSEFVLLELAAAFAAPAFRQGIIRFINALSTLPEVRIEAAHPHWYQAGWQVYQHRLDKAWSLTDCISIAIMQHYRLTDAFTSDRHFEQAGFRRLLLAP